MKNREIAKIFYEMADHLEIESVPFKPYAYRKAALALENLKEDVQQYYLKKGTTGLEKIPGIGESISQKIEEYLKTGKIKAYQQLKKKMPVNMDELRKVEGLGPKTIKTLHKKLKIKNLKDLEKAAKNHKIASLFGFRAKTEENILQGIAFLKKNKGRSLLVDVLPIVMEMEKKFKRIKDVEKISVAGSVRRKKETIRDIDFLITSKNPKKVMDYFCSFPEVVKIWAQGSTKSSIRIKQGLDIDLRIVSKKSYGSALQYLTGSKEHNVAVRRVAISKKLKLNEYGLFRGKRRIAGETEEGVYKALGMKWILPEIRENRGEIQASIQEFQDKPNGLPKLIELKDIKGDLHSHSKWSDGNNTILEMANGAIKKGYQYLGITDHTKFLRISHGLNEKELLRQKKEIIKLNEKFKKENIKFRVLQGAETNILNNGSLDINDNALKKLDFAMAGVHSSFRMKRAKMTERIIRALKNPYVKILVHPLGRIIQKRDEIEMDFDKILRAAKQFNVILEINAYPERLDLNDINIRRARESGVKMAINSDSHCIDHLEYMEFGVYQARRGWAEKKDIINTQSLTKLLNFFK
ncbi:MAG: DNA polymerase/3'-5' exonuclease PolX [Patescibacteria group bacterium]|nr:DNA polymerase/3'-5' exonuclease PolX [Patescibacteria group bacterium]